jgi:predicted dehydrogenase
VTFVAVADANESLLARFVEETGCDSNVLFFEARDMFENVKLDAVLGCLATGDHVHLTELCAYHKVALFVEKPMALSLDQSDLITTAIQRSSIPFMLHFSELWHPAVREAGRLAKEGTIGTLWHARYRIGHAGPRHIRCSAEFLEWLLDSDSNPSGAFLDLCCYGAQLSVWLLGRPQSAVAVASTLSKGDHDVYDNGILILKYGHAFGVAEGSWTQTTGVPPSGPFFAGSKGSIAVIGDAIQLINEEFPDGKTWIPDPPQPPNRNGVEYFLHHVRTDRYIEAPWNLLTSRDAQETLEAGLRSIQTGIECPLPVR